MVTAAAKAKSKALAQGTLDGDGVLVADVAAANRLHNKSLAGTPQPGNQLRLSLVEAAHCVVAGWLEVPGPTGPLGLADLLARGAHGGHRAEVDYLVYRDLRERGFAARHAPGTGHFDVWPRGTAQGAAAFQVVACADSDPVLPSDLSQGANGKVVPAVVDEDSAITHYTLTFEDPKGAVPEATIPTASGWLLADRVLVTDAAAIVAYSREFLGSPHGDSTFLSTLEAEALRQRGLLKLVQDGRAAATPPAPLLGVYLALRKAGVVPKSGFRFGAHLRGYTGNPDEGHAEWLIHCAAPSEALSWSALSRGVRLAHGVRKHFLVAIPTGNAVQFVRLAWFRP